MNYETAWQTLESLIVELRQKEITVPPGISDDLKSARTLLTIYQTEPMNGNVESELALYLEKIEPILLSLAECEVSKNYADIWQEKITNARMETAEKVKTASRFIAGIPKGEHWLRIKTTDIISDGDVNKLTQDLNLTIKPQSDGYLLVIGNQENIKTFVKEVRKKIGKGKFD